MRKRNLIVALFAIILLSTSFLRSEKVDSTIFSRTVFTPQIEPEFVEIEYIVHTELDLPVESWDGKSTHGIIAE